MFDTPPKGSEGGGGILSSRQQDLDSTNPFAMVAELNNRTQPGFFCLFLSKFRQKIILKNFQKFFTGLPLNFFF